MVSSSEDVSKMQGHSLFGNVLDGKVTERGVKSWRIFRTPKATTLRAIAYSLNDTMDEMLVGIVSTGKG